MTKRHLIQAKFNNKCAYCGEELDYKDLTIDHIKPKSKGGTKDENNLYPSCQKCNGAKADLSIEQFRIICGGGLFYFELKEQRERQIVEAANKRR